MIEPWAYIGFGIFIGMIIMALLIGFCTTAREDGEEQLARREGWIK